ncbi:MAG: DUF1289 domain-containing protein [Chthonomonadaceae bacterium]|nr:DUF1289 domain-containing protein [Chthonomonadaceae bacterium]
MTQIDSASPCRGTCELDPLLVCTGCGRTINEIADWPFLSEHDRATVIDRARFRLHLRQTDSGLSEIASLGLVQP